MQAATSSANERCVPRAVLPMVCSGHGAMTNTARFSLPSFRAARHFAPVLPVTQFALALRLMAYWYKSTIGALVAVRSRNRTTADPRSGLAPDGKIFRSRPPRARHCVLAFKLRLLHRKCRLFAGARTCSRARIALRDLRAPSTHPSA